MPILIVMVGPSGSGKSTWIKEYLAKHPDFKVVSPDTLRKEILGNVSDQSRGKEIWDKAYARTKKNLLSGQNVIFDATMVSEKSRKDLRDFLQDVPHKLFYKVMQAEDLKTLASRVNKDIESGVERSKVPAEAIERQMAKFKSDINKISKDQLMK